MIENNPATIAFRGQTFYGIRGLGFDDRGGFIVDMYSTPMIEGHQGGYFTSIPISPREYRREHGSRAAYRDDGDSMVLYDDWGRGHRFVADRAILDKLVAECKEQELPASPPASGDDRA